MKTPITELGQDFVILTEEDARALWEEEGHSGECPAQLIVFASTMGQDGLMWETFEAFWVDYAMIPCELDGSRLLENLISFIVGNRQWGMPVLVQAMEKVLPSIPPSQRMALINILSE